MGTPATSRRFRRRELRGVVFSLEDPTITKKERQLSVHVSDMYGNLTVHIRKFVNRRPTKEGVAFNYAAWLELMNQMTLIDLAVHTNGNPTALTIDKIRNLTVEDGGSPEVRITFKREDNCTQVEVCFKCWQRFVVLRPDICAAIEKHRTQCKAEAEAKKLRQSIVSNDQAGNCTNTALPLMPNLSNPYSHSDISNNIANTVTPNSLQNALLSNSFRANSKVTSVKRPLLDTRTPSVQWITSYNYSPTSSMNSAGNGLMPYASTPNAQLGSSSDSCLIWDNTSLAKARAPITQITDSTDYIKSHFGNAANLSSYRVSPLTYLGVNPSRAIVAESWLPESTQYSSQWNFNIDRIKKEPSDIVPWFTNAGVSGSQHGMADCTTNSGNISSSVPYDPSAAELSAVVERYSAW